MNACKTKEHHTQIKVFRYKTRQLCVFDADMCELRPVLDVRLLADVELFQFQPLGCAEMWLGTWIWQSILPLDNTRTWSNNESDYLFRVRKCKQNDG